MNSTKKNTHEILSHLGIKALNPMQEAVVEVNAPEGDMILLSQTGSGKTLAFLLLLYQNIHPEANGTQAMVVVPSRELALQIDTVWKTMRTGAKVTVCYGGHKREIEENSLTEAPALIIGTPGRLADHLRRGNIKPETIHTLVLDEYDKCLELGFEADITEVMTPLTQLKKRVLVSATAPETLGVNIPLQQPLTLDFLGALPEQRLEVTYLDCQERDKLPELFLFLCVAADRSSIVFCNHRDAVKRTADFLTEKGISNVYYHGALEQRNRELALAKFRNGSVRTLVTTDLAARGLDIPNIRYIIHFHLPHTEDSYTHRNGRTARVDRSGTVVLIKGVDESLPDFVPQDIEAFSLPESAPLPEKTQWVTFCFGSGKKDKLNKVDIVGFLSHKGKLSKEDIGLIEVKDYMAFAAVRRKKANTVLPLITNERIKGKKPKVEIL